MFQNFLKLFFKSLLFFGYILSSSVYALDNGLAKTPPMGWMDWERFRCVTDCKLYPYDCISEKLFIDMADRLAEDGWAELGYKYVSIDDCWMAKSRDTEGKLYADPERFPHGIKGLADYIHSRDLKLGIYEDFGSLTCGGYPGSQGFVEIDAKTFAEWGVDMLKFDGCYSNDSSKAIGYPLMSKALNSTNRPILYSCSWPAYEGGIPPKVNYTELGEICNSWRNYGDIQDSFDSVLSIIEWYATNQDVLVQAAGPQHWNDPDMLIVGDFSLSFSQSKLQFGMWCMLAAPLFMSNDLRRISRDAEIILKNELAISINQDPLGIQAKRYIIKDHVQAWSRPLTHGCFAVAIFSTRSDDVPYTFSFNLHQLNITSDDDVIFSLYEVFESRDYGEFFTTEQIRIGIRTDEIQMFYVKPLKQQIFASIFSDNIL